MKKLLVIVVAATLASPAAAQVRRYDFTLEDETGTGSPGTGTGTVFFNEDTSEMRLVTEFSGLIGDVTVAHIHCCTEDLFAGNAGVATPTPTFPGFPSGETFGSYDMTFDMTAESSYNGSFITEQGSVEAALSSLLDGFDTGRAYLNIHTTEHGGGEIRGIIPEPASALLALGGVTVLGVARRRRVR